MKAKNVTFPHIPLVGVALFSLACLQEPAAQLSSFVTNENNQPVADATITILNLDEIEYSSAMSLEDGSFSVDLPPLQTFFAVISHADNMTSSFTGIAGEGYTEIEEGILNIESNSSFFERAEQFSDCSLDYNYIEGQVRIAIPDQETDILPTVTTARAIAFNSSLESTQACYINPTTDPPQTGETGRYLISGQKSGIHEILLNVEYDAQNQVEYSYLVYVPEQGRAALIPTLIPL